MKKLKQFLAGAFMAFALLLCPHTIYAAENFSVTIVDDITDVKDVTGTSYAVGTGNYSNLVKFTLDKPSYVYVSAFSTVSYGNWSSLGTIERFAVYSDANCSNLVTGDTVVGIFGNSQQSKYLCLDAGSYYVYFAKGDANADEYAMKSSGEVRLSVAAEYLSVDGTKNGSWNRAKKISTDKDVKGFLSTNTRTSWFKFTVGNNTTAQLRLCLENSLGEKNYPTTNVGVTVYRSNRSIVERLNITDAYYESVYSNTLTLKQGTYYIAISGDSSYDKWNNTKLDANSNYGMGIVNFRITTIKKATISKVTNQSGKKAKVTFKAVSGAKGYEIQYATNKNFNSAKTTKASAQATNVTLKNLKKNKTYYVRVRAYKNDADGNKVYGAWSAYKTVKIKK